MKKIFLLLLGVVFFISGCAANRMTREEGVTSSFAYVVGKYTVSWQTLSFSLNGESELFNPQTSFSVSSSDSYAVMKVLPGRYTASFVALSSNSSLMSRHGQPLATVYLEPGKITYIGDIAFSTIGGTGGGGAPVYTPSGGWSTPASSQSVTPVLDVENNSEAVKNAIREKYPELAQNLDAIFVYKPAQ